MIGGWNIFAIWGALVGVFFLCAQTYVYRHTGVNFWRLWWRKGNIGTERRFAEEVRKFPRLNAGYQAVKWSTPVVILAVLLYSIVNAWTSQPSPARDSVKAADGLHGTREE